MQYARDRGVDVYVFTWNIFAKGTENSGYGLTDDPANATTKDWVRRATRTLFDTYPLLAGIGVTAGENMGEHEQRGEGAVVLGHLRVGGARRRGQCAEPGQSVLQPQPRHPFDSPGAPDETERDHRELPEPARLHQRGFHLDVQLQVFAGAHVFVRSSRSSSTRTDGSTRSPPGRRPGSRCGMTTLLLYAVGRPGFCAVVSDQPAGPVEDRRVLHGAGRVLLGPGIREQGTGLAAPAFAERKRELEQQMVSELKAQEDPRMSGQGEIFEQYPYANAGQRDFHERYMKGEKLKAGWVDESDFEKQPLD